LDYVVWGVFMRCAEKLWGPWSETVEIFNFFVNGGSNFMNGPSAYGPYIIPRFTKFDPLSRELTIYYNMSTWVPYQVMLMRTVLREDCSYDDAFRCPSGGAISIPPIPDLVSENLPPSEG
jgi:Domain of unknown function (DUF4185)